MPPTYQQTAIIAHDQNTHGRVIAGPGTGKSWTAISYLRRVHSDYPDLKVKLLTFTRAATGELVKKVAAEGIDWLEPATVHGYALQVLLHNSHQGSLILPLRIPDSWEMKELIHPDLAQRLRARRFDVDTRKVRKLEREMSAQWESLDPSLELLTDIEPALRSAYVGLWKSHRQTFGYVLMAEIPFRAGDLVEDFSPAIGGLQFLIVDEYQDLNRADIRFIKAIAELGVHVMAIGDDDQSIYGFRMAAPEGIMEFPATFPGTVDYPLTIGMRCGENITSAATSLIETAPNRIQRPALSSMPGAVHGQVVYLRFAEQIAEANGVARLVDSRRRAGVAEKDIAILVRSNVDTWAALLVPELEALGIRAVDTDWIGRALADKALRRALAVARLAIDNSDSIAWWALFRLTPGISDEFVHYVERATQDRERFGQCVLRLFPSFAGAPTTRSQHAAAQMVKEQLAAIAALDLSGIPGGASGWGEWLANRVTSGSLSDNAAALLDRVGRVVPAEDGLASFLGQLEPVGKDLATQADAVRIMSMGASKGLTVNTAIVMGVEAGIIPHPKGNEDEERRLLYVAMTRATDFCALTFAQRRTGPTARHGVVNVNQPRGRCPLFQGLPISQWSDGNVYLEEAEAADGSA